MVPQEEFRGVIVIQKYSLDTENRVVIMAGVGGGRGCKGDKW